MHKRREIFNFPRHTQMRKKERKTRKHRNFGIPLQFHWERGKEKIVRPVWLPRNDGKRTVINLDAWTILYISLYIACPCSQEISRHPNTSKRKIETCHLDLRPRKLRRRRTYDTVGALQPTTFTLGLRCNFLTTPIEDRSGIKWMCLGVEKS
jgi:hypothetical protein